MRLSCNKKSYCINAALENLEKTKLNEEQQKRKGKLDERRPLIFRR